MNRLKFRVWNPRYKKYEYWGFLNPNEFQGITTGGGLSLDYCRDNSEQFTGLLDGDREVWEGDLYLYCGNEFAVTWFEDRFLLVALSDDVIGDYELAWALESGGFEYIGNIHEAKGE